MPRLLLGLMPVSFNLADFGWNVVDNHIMLLDFLRNYLVQTRQELAARLIERLYADGTNVPSKWWMCFTKRRFMNRN